MTLATNELTIVDNDQLGRIEFRSPIATAGTDAIVTAASIWAEANATFSASVNAADIVFATAASGAATEKMRILSSGNVGIGVAAPTHELDIRQATGTNYIKIVDTRSTTGDSAGVLMGTGGSGAGKSLVAHIETGANGIGDMVFAVDAVNDSNDAVLADEKMRISSAGDVYSVPWTDYYSSSTIVGWSSLTAGRRQIMYRTLGDMVWVSFHLEGTSNSGSSTFTVPYTAVTVATSHSFGCGLGFTYDNASYVANGTCRLGNNSNIVYCAMSAGAAWTSSGAKTVEGEFWYMKA